MNPTIFLTILVFLYLVATFLVSFLVLQYRKVSKILLAYIIILISTWVLGYVSAIVGQLLFLLVGMLGTLGTIVLQFVMATFVYAFLFRKLFDIQDETRNRLAAAIIAIVTSPLWYILEVFLGIETPLGN